MKKKVCSILVLTEDSSREAVPTLRELLRHMIRLVDPHANRDRVALEPSTDEDAVRASKGRFGKVETPEIGRRTSG